MQRTHNQGLQKSSVHRLLAASLSTLAISMAMGSAIEASSQARMQASSESWAPVDCSEFKLKDLPEGIDCGYVTVPLRHDDPTASTIQLATVIVRSQAQQPAPDPLFMAQGGPGGSSIDTYAQAIATTPDYSPAPNRDIVIWDQRGTLFSKPSLTCPEVSEAELLEALAGGDDRAEEDDLRPYLECGERLAKEAGDLSAFNTVENANDVESLRVALGYDLINFYGVSYGTELGQFVLRQQPEHLRSVILDAVVPTTFNLVTDPAFVKQRIAEKYFYSCAQEERCDLAFPNLAERFLALLDRLDEDPVVLPLVRADTKPLETYQVRVKGSDLMEILYQALYMQSLQPLIPYVVDRADQGDFSLLASILLPVVLFDESMATGMYLSVVCAERGSTDPHLADYSGLVQRLGDKERRDAQAILQVCRQWDIELLPETVLEPVVSDTPTLLLSGDFDPITPPPFAAQVGETLSQSYQVVFPKGTHGQAVSDLCANGIIQRFLDDPTTAPEAACAQAPPPAYLVPSDVTILPPLHRAVSHPDLEGLGMLVLGSVRLLLALLALGTAVPVYFLGWVLRRRRHEPPPASADSRSGALARAVPWIAVVAFSVLAGFLVALGFALAADAMQNPMLYFLGVIPSQFQWILLVPPGFVGVVALMVVVALAIWVGGQRSLPGRLYFSFLTIAGLVAASSLWKLGLVTALLGS